jgi:cobalt-zinc-cadmium efflux system outer membrane protein
MKACKRLFAVGLSLLMVGAVTQAQTAPSVDALTLEQALALAEQNHPGLVEAGALVRAAEGRVQQAGVRPNPEAIARMENAPFRGNTTGNADYLAGVGLTIPLGNRREQATRVEDLNRQRLGFEAGGQRLELHRLVQSEFAIALYQEQARHLRGELVTAAEQGVQVTRARLDAGDAIPTDLARVEVELATAQAEWKRSDLLRRQALVSLASTIGLPADDVRGVQGSLGTTLEIPALEELTVELATHPAMAAAGAALSAREAGVSLSRVQRIPDLKAELLYHRIESSQRDAFDVGLSLPLPLFDRGRGRVREAEAQRDAAEARMRSTQRELRIQLREAHGLLTAALSDARTLETQVLPKMKTVREGTEARYAAGDLSLGEALSVRREEAGVRLRYLEALRDTMLAWAELRPFLKP